MKDREARKLLTEHDNRLNKIEKLRERVEILERKLDVLALHLGLRITGDEYTLRYGGVFEVVERCEACGK